MRFLPRSCIETTEFLCTSILLVQKLPCEFSKIEDESTAAEAVEGKAYKYLILLSNASNQI